MFDLTAFGLFDFLTLYSTEVWQYVVDKSALFKYIKSHNRIRRIFG